MQRVLRPNIPITPPVNPPVPLENVIGKMEIGKNFIIG